jgi:A/G-specific adenine glycosylase
MGKQGWDAKKIARVRRRLLAWYERNRRDLPWRRTRDPYAIWLSEIMLQQTRVAAVVERYKAFLKRFPTLRSLARAPEQEVLAQWSGLGYYRRARNLQKAAQVVVAEHRGKLPQSAAELRQLPGIGAYTAAAIASIAHNEPVAVVDGNVERVLCRMEGWKADGSAAVRRKIEALAAELVASGSAGRPGEFNQAMMELGATLCLPRNPQCGACPVTADCKTQGEHATAPRPPIASREAAYALAVREGREVLLEQRPATQSVMPGLWELPALGDTSVPESKIILTLRHAIMQVNYRVRIRAVAEEDLDALTIPGGERRWVALDEAAAMALTGLARKVIARIFPRILNGP